MAKQISNADHSLWFTSLPVLASMCVIHIVSSENSCFYHSADFFANRKNEDYKPSKRKLKHVEAVLKLLEVFTGDSRYKEIEDTILEEEKKGVSISMCEFADRMENRGIAKGVKQEKSHGIDALVCSLKKYHVSDENILKEIINQYSLSKAAAQKFL